MRVLLSEAAQNEFLPVSGLTLADALDAVLRADASEAIDLPGGGQLAVYAKAVRRGGQGGQAGRGEQAPAEFTVLAGGQEQGDDVNVDYVLKLPPDLTAPAAGLNPTPIRMLSNLLGRVGCRVGIGPRGGKLILAERIPIWTNNPEEIVRVEPPPGNTPVLTHLMLRPAAEDGQNYADCAVCFAVDVVAYRRYLAAAGRPT